MGEVPGPDTPSDRSETAADPTTETVLERDPDALKFHLQLLLESGLREDQQELTLHIAEMVGLDLNPTSPEELSEDFP